MKDDLTLLYRSYSVVQLLEILDHRSEYTALAIEVAENEWAQRRVTPEQLKEAKQDLESRRIAAAQEKDWFVVIAEKAARFLGRIYHQVNPTTQKTPEQAIVLISGFIGLNLLFKIFSDLNFFGSMLGSIEDWDMSSLRWFLPYFFMPGIIYFFYKKTSAGWTMLSIWLTYTVMSAVYAYAFEVTLLEGVFHDGDEDAPGILEGLSPMHGFSYYFFVVLIYGGMLYYINTKAITRIFGIKKLTPVFSIGLTALAVTVLWVPLFM